MCQEFSWTNINKTINLPAEKSGSISHYKKYVNINVFLLSTNTNEYEIFVSIGNQLIFVCCRHSFIFSEKRIKNSRRFSYLKRVT